MANKRQENSVKVMGKWVDAAQKQLNETQLKDFCYGIIAYGLYQVEIDCDEKTSMALGMVYPQIDDMQDAYNTILKVNEDQEDKYRARDIKIWQLAHDKGLKMQAIQNILAEETGELTPLFTLYKCQGWKQRGNDKPDFMEGVLEDKEANNFAKLPNEIAMANNGKNNELPNGKDVAKKLEDWQLF